MITSETNARIKELGKLQKNMRVRKKSGLFVVEGLKLVKEASVYGELEAVYISEKLWESYWQAAPVEEVAKEWQAEWKEGFLEIVSTGVFQKISDTVTPQGILGIVKMPVYEKENYLYQKDGFFLILDDIRDPGNLGTILRTAEGAGVSCVIMSKGCVDIFNPKVVRSTMGAIFRLPFFVADDLTDWIGELKAQGMKVFGTMMEGSEIYYQVDFRQATGIVIGNEANGISKEVAEQLSGRLRIPMAGKTESLNAAVASAVIMYEAARQRSC